MIQNVVETVLKKRKGILLDSKKSEEEKLENEVRQPNQEESINILKPNLGNKILNMKDEIMKIH